MIIFMRVRFEIDMSGVFQEYRTVEQFKFDENIFVRKDFEVTGFSLIIGQSQRGFILH